MIKVSGPWITEREIGLVAEAAAKAWQESAYEYHDRFERIFARFLGRQHAMALPSCTSALHLALAVSGVGPGDEVIVPDLTWIATAAPVTYLGATPVFADVDPLTFCMDADSFASRIGPRTRAVIPVDLYGAMPKHQAICRIAEDKGIAVIEDAAQAIGAERDGLKAGCYGRIATFSFHGSKTITTGEGGMLVTDDPAILARADFLRDHGRSRADRSLWNAEIGFKYRMSAMQAAMGIGQMERIGEIVRRKRDIFGWYKEELGGFDRVRLNPDVEGLDNSYWMVTIIGQPALPMPKESLIAELKRRGIETRPIHYPLSQMPAFRRHDVDRDWAALNPVAYRISANGINLPSGLQLTREDVAEVCSALRAVLSGLN